MIDTPLDPNIGTGSSGRAAVKLTVRTVALLGLAFKATATKGSGKFCVAAKGRSCPGVAGSAFAFQAAGTPPYAGSFDAVWSVAVDGLCTEARGVAITIG